MPPVYALGQVLVRAYDQDWLIPNPEVFGGRGDEIVRLDSLAGDHGQTHQEGHLHDHGDLFAQLFRHGDPIGLVARKKPSRMGSPPESKKATRGRAGIEVLKPPDRSGPTMDGIGWKAVRAGQRRHCVEAAESEIEPVQQENGGIGMWFTHGRIFGGPSSNRQT